MNVVHITFLLVLLPVFSLAYLIIATLVEGALMRAREEKEDEIFERDMIRLYGGDEMVTESIGLPTNKDLVDFERTMKSAHPDILDARASVFVFIKTEVSSEEGRVAAYDAEGELIRDNKDISFDFRVELRR